MLFLFPRIGDCGDLELENGVKLDEIVCLLGNYLLIKKFVFDHLC